MPDWGDVRGIRFETLGSNSGTSEGVVVIAPSGAHSKVNSWTALGVTAFHATGIYVNVHNMTGILAYLDISIGTATGIIIPDIAIDRPATAIGLQYYFPISVPAGTALWARTQSATISATMSVSVTLVSGEEFLAGQAVQTFGLVTGSTTGTSITPSVNTEGVSTVIAGTVLRPLRYLSLALGTLGRTANQNASYLVDIRVNDGTVYDLISNIPFRTGSTPDIPGQCFYGPYTVSVPVGAAFQVRAQTNFTGGQAKTISAVLYGVS